MTTNIERGRQLLGRLYSVLLTHGSVDVARGEIENLVAGLRVEALRDIARSALYDGVGHLARERALAIERANHEARDAEREAQAESPEGRRRARERDDRFRQEAAEVEARRAERMRSIIQEFADDMRMQWTAELLDAEFAMGDGTVVTWGDATVDQHQARLRMLQRNAEANIETAARHKKALETLAQTGAPSLRRVSS